MKFGGASPREQVRRPRYANGPMFELPLKYKIRNIIGKNGPYPVCSALNTEAEQLVAISKLYLAQETMSEAKETLRKIKMLPLLKHKNVVGFIEIVPSHLTKYTRDEVLIVYELMSSDLKHFMELDHTISTKNVLYQILCGLKYLHSGWIVLKSLNMNSVLVNRIDSENWDIKISDYHIGNLNRSTNLMAEYFEPGMYQAPEVLLKCRPVKTQKRPLPSMMSEAVVPAETPHHRNFYPNPKRTRHSDRVNNPPPQSTTSWADAKREIPRQAMTNIPPSLCTSSPTKESSAATPPKTRPALILTPPKRIIYLSETKVFYTNINDFKSLAQKLTGMRFPSSQVESVCDGDVAPDDAIYKPAANKPDFKSLVQNVAGMGFPSSLVESVCDDDAASNDAIYKPAANISDFKSLVQNLTGMRFPSSQVESVCDDDVAPNDAIYKPAANISEPETLLQTQETSVAADIWSVGCILMELLTRTPLFPSKGGDTCQLRYIIELLGTPSEDELWFLTEDSKNLVRSLPYCKVEPLHEKFPYADPLAIDLVSKMLVFDPRKRIAAADALAHSYLAEMHVGPMPLGTLLDYFLDLDAFSHTELTNMIYNELASL